MLTYQDYLKTDNVTKWLQSALVEYTNSAEYKSAKMQAEYMAGRDTEIVNTVKLIYDMTGMPATDYTASNNRISSNILHRLISQRCTYSLGNGVSFAGSKQERGEDGKTHTVDAVKDLLGNRFDTAVYRAAYWACGNGESYTYVHKGHRVDKWEFDLFKRVEFLPLYDELTGQLRGGIRFFSVDSTDYTKPIIATLYTERGYQRYQTPEGEYGFAALAPMGEITPYTEHVNESEADGVEVVSGRNFSTLPIIPLYPNESRTSVLDNLKAKIDALDMALSGFANDMQDVAQIYWLVSGALGATDDEMAALRDKAKYLHILNIDGDHSSITPYTQEPPYAARQAFINELIDKIYADFGALNVLNISAAQKTATEIEAAYQPMDEEADAFEYQLIEYIQGILSIVGVEDMPIFKRNRVSNQKEQTEMILMAESVLDKQTILEKLPWISVDEVDDILSRLDAQETADKQDMEELRRAIDEERANSEEDRHADDAGGNRA